MSQFDFTTDAKSIEYCNIILDHIVNEIAVPRDEAVQKMNALWKDMATL